MSRLRALLRPVIVYGTLLTVSLVGAYVSWTAEVEDPGEDEVVVLDIARDDLQGIRYEAEALSVTISPRSDDFGGYLWVETDRTVQEPAKPAPKPEPKPEPAEVPAAGTDTDAAGAVAGETDGPDVAADGAAAVDTDPPPDADPPGEAPEPPEEPKPEPEPRREQKAFKGGPSADKLADAMAPLRAKRALDGVTDDRLAELGLAEPTARLTIAHGSGEATLELGDTVFGGDSRYARDATTGRIYLLDARVLRPLASAHHSMVDRELFRGEPGNLESIDVEVGGRTVTLEHRNRADRDAAYWALAGEQAEHPTAAAWLKKLLRMRAREFLPEGGAPSGAELVFAYTVQGASETPVRVEVHRGATDGGQEAWYAHSAHARGWVEVYRAQASDVAADVGTLFGDAKKAQPREEEPGGGGDRGDAP